MSTWNERPYALDGVTGIQDSPGRFITVLQSAVTAYPDCGTSGHNISKGDPCLVGTLAGVAMNSCTADTDYVTIDTQGVFNVTVKSHNGTAGASGAIGAAVYMPSDGALDLDPSGNFFGVLLAAITTSTHDAGVVAPVLIASGPSNALFGPNVVANASADWGIPFVINKVLTATTAETKSITTSFPRKARLIKASFVARDANAANVTLKGGTLASEAAMTEVKAKGTSAAVVVDWASIVDATKDLAAGKSLLVDFSAQGAIEVNLWFLPIA